MDKVIFMPGMFGIISNQRKIQDINYEISYLPFENLIEDEVKYHNFFIKRYVTPKFIDDKVFYNGDDLVICTDGIILNLSELKQKYNVFSTDELLRNKYYNIDDLSFASDLKGNFSGVIYDKKVNNYFSLPIISVPRIFFIILRKTKNTLFSVPNSNQL